MSIERRASRLQLSIPVLVETEGTVKRCLAADVSDCGMLVVSPDPFRIGDRLHVTFTLPWTDVEIAVSTEVLHVTWSTELSSKGHFRIGLRFLDFDRAGINMPIRCLPC